MYKVITVVLLLLNWRMVTAQSGFPAWQQGYMDIHHINTGRGNATFFVLPDGTTLLVDAGDLDRGAFEKKYFPLKAAPALPSDTVSSASAIVGYIGQVAPSGRQAVIDYALITHFHGDHYGGIMAVGEKMHIRTVIDRGYPAYDFPTDLRSYYKAEPSSFLNYLNFIDKGVAAGNMTAAKLAVGRDDQMVLRYDPSSFPEFHIRNLKVNQQVWTGKGEKTRGLFSPGELLDKKGNFNENPLSLAIKISYGKFDYYTGGDNTGREGEDLPGGRDTETPMAAAVGKVEVMTLDHHGNRDASNTFFLKTLQPRVVIAQTWCSDQPGQEIAHRLAGVQPATKPPEVFYLYLHEETKVTLGPWITRAAKSMEGHVVIRVLPGGNEFYVFVMDDRSPSLKIKDRFGPYWSE